MKKHLARIIVGILIFSTLGIAQRSRRKPASAPQATAAAAAQPEFKVPFVNKTLANGLEVIVLQDSSVPLITVELAVRNGSFTEPPELNGLSHLYEHMFFKTNGPVAVFRCDYARSIGRMDVFERQGCNETLKLRSQYGDVGYLRDLDKAGFVRNGSTQEEYVNYYFSATSEHLRTIMQYMRDATLFPAFDGDEFQMEKQVVVAELDRQLSEPFYYLDRTLMDNLFYKYPSRKSPGGTRETVASATTEKMRLIQSRYYVPNNSALIVTGDANPENVFRLAEELFGGWQKGEDPFIKHPMVEHPPLEKSKGLFVEQEIENVVIQLGWHGPSIGKDDAGTYAADVFSFIMEQPNSRLSRAMIDSGLAVGISVHYYTQRNTGPIRITLVTPPDRAKAALTELYKQIGQFNSAAYFSNEELANAKNLLEAEDLYRRDKLSEYTHSLGFWWSSTGVDYYRGYHAKLRAVSRQDISKYLTTYVIGKPHVAVAMMSSGARNATGLTEADLIGN